MEESKGVWEQVDLTTLVVRPWVKLEESTGSAADEGPERLPFMEQKGKQTKLNVRISTYSTRTPQVWQSELIMRLQFSER